MDARTYLSMNHKEVVIVYAKDVDSVHFVECNKVGWDVSTMKCEFFGLHFVPGSASPASAAQTILNGTRHKSKKALEILTAIANQKVHTMATALPTSNMQPAKPLTAKEKAAADKAAKAAAAVEAKAAKDKAAAEAKAAVDKAKADAKAAADKVAAKAAADKAKADAKAAADKAKADAKAAKEKAAADAKAAKEAEKAAKATAKAAAKAERDAAKAAGKKVYDRVPYKLEQVVTFVTDPNPKRGASKERFAAYKVGKTLAAAVDAGATLSDLQWDLQRGLIKV